MPFLTFLMGPIGRMVLIGLVLLAAAAAGAAKMHAHDQKKYDALDAKYAALESAHTGFVNATAAEGKRAEAERAAREAKDKQDKGAADAQNKQARARDAGVIARLRADAAKRDSRGGAAGANPAGSKCPEGLTCFDRAEYERTIGAFDSGARRLAGEGTAVTTDLDSAKTWAQTP